MAVLVKADIIKIFSNITGLPIDEAHPVVDYVLYSMRRLIEEMYPGDRLAIRGFGTFKVDKYNSRPHTMKWVDKKVYSAAHRTVKFKAGGALRKKLKELYPEGSEKK